MYEIAMLDTAEMLISVCVIVVLTGVIAAGVSLALHGLPGPDGTPISERPTTLKIRCNCCGQSISRRKSVINTDDPTTGPTDDAG